MRNIIELSTSVTHKHHQKSIHTRYTLVPDVMFTYTRVFRLTPPAQYSEPKALVVAASRRLGRTSVWAVWAKMYGVKCETPPRARLVTRQTKVNPLYYPSHPS